MATNGLVIAGLGSGSGKTTLTLGILRALSRRGVRGIASAVPSTMLSFDQFSLQGLVGTVTVPGSPSGTRS